MEGRGDHTAAYRPHRGRAAREITHPPCPQADAGEPLLRLRREVDERVKGIGGIVRAPGKRKGHALHHNGTRPRKPLALSLSLRTAPDTPKRSHLPLNETFCVAPPRGFRGPSVVAMGPSCFGLDPG